MDLPLLHQDHSTVPHSSVVSLTPGILRWSVEDSNNRGEKQDTTLERFPAYDGSFKNVISPPHTQSHLRNELAHLACGPVC